MDFFGSFVPCTKSKIPIIIFILVMQPGNTVANQYFDDNNQTLFTFYYLHCSNGAFHYDLIEY